MAHTQKTTTHETDLFAREGDDALVAALRALVVNDPPRARALVARFLTDLQDPVLRRFAEADEDDEASAEADAWAEAELREALAEGKWHSADEAKRALLGACCVDVCA